MVAARKEIEEKPVRVRFAPSPTGPLHVGGARTALFNWLFARKHGGSFILRIEDTDVERSEKKYDTELIEGLTWLGLDWDEGPAFAATEGSLKLEGYKGAFGPYRQSERTEMYKKYLEELLAKNEAYYCYCTKEDLEAQRQSRLSQGLPPKYTGHCRNLTEPPVGKKPEVIRFKVPEIKVEFKDLVRGKVTFDAGLFGDIVIAKDLEHPLYNFAVVVDDALMEITHVIRGEDHLSNTPKQILMQKALGFGEPLYGHIPLILNADRSKMSKRFSDVALSEYRKKGYLPQALLNFLALLGWHPKGDQEVMTVKELIDQFDLARVQPAGAVFNVDKLDWLNREHLKKMSDAEVTALVLDMFTAENIIVDKNIITRMVPVERSRVKTLKDFIDASKIYFAVGEYEAPMLIWKEAPAKEVKTVLEEALKALEAVKPENFTRETLSTSLSFIIGERNRGAVLWPLRVALSGQSSSPDPIDIMIVLGKEASLIRIRAAIQKLA